MFTLHHHYDQLTTREKAFVDYILVQCFEEARQSLLDKLAGDDRAERVADALAVWVIGSRKKRGAVA